MSFNHTHPECLDGEVFLTNIGRDMHNFSPTPTFREDFNKIGWTTKRMGGGSVRHLRQADPVHASRVCAARGDRPGDGGRHRSAERSHTGRDHERRLPVRFYIVFGGRAVEGSEPFFNDFPVMECIGRCASDEEALKEAQESWDGHDYALWSYHEEGDIFTDERLVYHAGMEGGTPCQQ